MSRPADRHLRRFIAVAVPQGRHVIVIGIVRACRVTPAARVRCLLHRGEVVPDRRRRFSSLVGAARGARARHAARPVDGQARGGLLGERLRRRVDETIETGRTQGNAAVDRSAPVRRRVGCCARCVEFS